MNTQSYIIDDVLQNKNCKLVRKAYNRCVYYHKCGNGAGHYVKIFDLSGFLTFLSLIKIKKEIKQHIFLKNKGLSLPDLVGTERRHRKFCIVTKEIFQGIVLTEFFLKKNFSDLEKKNILKSATRFLFDNYNNGFLHNDLHFGNIIFIEPEQKFYFLDPKQIIFRKNLSYRKKLKNFCLLYNSLMGRGNACISTQWDFLLNNFLEISGLEKYRKVAEKYTIGQFWKWVYRRTKRCFKMNSDFSFFKSKSYTGFYNNKVMNRLGVTGNKIAGFVNDVFSSEKTQYLKNSNTTAVARIKHAGRELAVKKFNVKRRYDPYKNFFRKSRAYRSWYWGWRLNLLNIPVPEPVFFCEKRVLGLLFDSYYAMRYEENSLTVMDFLNKCSADFVNDKFKKKLFLTKLAQFVRKCNNARLCHRDFQLKNILVVPETAENNLTDYSFRLIDLEAVSASYLSSFKISWIHLKQLKKSFLRLENHKIFFIKDILFFLRIVFQKQCWDKRKLKRLLDN